MQIDLINWCAIELNATTVVDLRKQEDDKGLVTQMILVVIPGRAWFEVTHDFVDINTLPVCTQDGR